MLGDDRSDPKMSDAEFRMLSELLRRRCGLHFGPESRFILEKRVARRLREIEVTSFSAYHYLVRNTAGGGGEFAQLVDELTTNETYFFRERGQLRALITEIIPELRRQRDTRIDAPVSIWSAGCSSGEEPYSIVVLAQQAGLVPGVDFRVYASDISQRMLHKARQGAYREASFRETDASLRDRYFAEKEGLWRISDGIKEHVDFIHLNLLDRSKIALLGAMDVILCRNVITPSSSATFATTWSTAGAPPACSSTTRGTRRPRRRSARSTAGRARNEPSGSDPGPGDRRLRLQQAGDHPHAPDLAAGRGGGRGP
jgi:chemotaxis protein methyltransferase CheR